MKRFLPVIILPILFLACSKEEEGYPFDQSPYLEFDRAFLFEPPLNSQVDSSIYFEFRIWDIGNGFWLGKDEFEPPYHSGEIVVDFNCEFVTISGDHTLPYHSEIVRDISSGVYPCSDSEFGFTSEEDNRPPFDCNNYSLFERVGESSIDTIYYIKNRYSHNLIVSYYDKNGNEVFLNGGCVKQKFRTPLEAIPSKSLQGVVFYGDFRAEYVNTYALDFAVILHDNPIRELFEDDELFEIRIQIFDRQLNESNIISSGLISLDGIKAE